MKGLPQVGVFAPSSKIPQQELSLGAARIRDAGFRVTIHSQCKKSDLFFSGTDEERAQGFLELAESPRYSVIWAARGGHGVIRVLPLLERLSRKRKIPSNKLLVGFSDSTGLIEYVRRRWGWSTLHGPMLATRPFNLLAERDWKIMASWIKRVPAPAPWLAGKKLEFWTPRPGKAIEGELVGGNLSVWTSLVGTPFEPQARGKLVFLEDTDESLYRIDRLLQQLWLSGSLNGARAILLGTFNNCQDRVVNVLKGPIPSNPQARRRVLETPKPSELSPLRKTLDQKTTLRRMFSELGDRLGIPVAFGLPVGHGFLNLPIPLGARYRLARTGELELLKWDWTTPHPQ